jgi:hypothetical protein
MQAIEAIKAASQILDEERARPTVEYTDMANAYVSDARGFTPDQIALLRTITSTPRFNLGHQRTLDPRPVSEHTFIYKFASVNFNLLMSVYSQLNEPDRTHLFYYVLRRVEAGGSGTSEKPPNYYFPVLGNRVCELPLIAEFCIRTGNFEAFFVATAKPQNPTVPFALMLMQLKETVALHWDLFSDDQLARIPQLLMPIREMAGRRMQSANKEPFIMAGNDFFHARHIIQSIDSISKECHQARYFYLKGALQRNVSLEIESDKSAVENFLTKLGFSTTLMLALDEAEKDYSDSSNAFRLKNCLGHLRSFLEHMHLEAAAQIAVNTHTTPPIKWGATISFLRGQGYITQQQEGFVTALYTFISDEGVHALMAERLFARLLRNMVIEYGYMFLTMIDDKGIKLHAKKVP